MAITIFNMWLYLHNTVFTQFLSQVLTPTELHFSQALEDVGFSVIGGRGGHMSLPVYLGNAFLNYTLTYDHVYPQ